MHSEGENCTGDESSYITYLGRIVSRDDALDGAFFKICIQKVNVAFGKLESRIWSDQDITIETKICMYV